VLIELIAWIVGSYLIAGIPVGLLIGRSRGVDLREVGSGNIGATNAVRAMGRIWGSLVFILDLAKAALPVWAASLRFAAFEEGPLWIAMIALAAIVGHVFPIYLRFRGGKGVACALGVFMILAPKAALLAMLFYVQTLWLTRISAVGSLTAVLAIVVLAWIDPSVPFPYVVLAAAVAGLIWERHRSNLERVLAQARETKSRESKL